MRIKSEYFFEVLGFFGVGIINSFICMLILVYWEGWFGVLGWERFDVMLGIVIENIVYITGKGWGCGDINILLFVIELIEYFFFMG